MKDCSTGTLLVASTMIESPMMARAVCLLVHHDEDSVIGLMLNRPMKVPQNALGELFGGQPPATGSKNPPRFELTNQPAGSSNDPGTGVPGTAGATPADQPVGGSLHFGGPLSGPLIAIHGASQLAEVETASGIYVAAQRDHLEKLIRDGDEPYRLIVGHLGWSADQLQAEIENGLWHLLPATADTVFGGDEEMWPRLVRRATAKSMADWLGIPDANQAYPLN